MRQWRAQERVPPVLLVTGPAGVGKREMVHHIAQWLLCERHGPLSRPNGASASDDESEASLGLFGAGTPEAPAPAEPLAASEDLPATPCGACASCSKALSGNWVDFREIGAEDSEGTLKIEQFRELKATLGFGAYDGAYRITLIRDADRMTPQAANSMLKLLEEPPRGWVFFLTARDPALLLPTLVSRCQTLRLRPLPSERIAELLALAEVPGDRRAACARLAQGSWSKALALATEEAWKQRLTLFRFLEQPQAELNALVEWASQDPANFDLLADQLEQVLEDLVRWSLSDGPAREWTNSDGQRALAAHAERAVQRLGSKAAAREFWLARAERLFRARQEALAPLNRKLLVQDLVVPWIGV